MLGSGSSYHQHRLQELGSRIDLQTEIQEMLQGACCPVLTGSKGKQVLGQWEYPSEKATKAR